MPIAQWTIGNTTVRNPERLRDGLVILKSEVEGKPWSANNQRKFLVRLIKEGLYEAGAAKTDEQKEQHGRIWGSVYNELGLIFAYRRRASVQLTPVGKTLLDPKVSPQEVYLRQLLKYQLPNPLPRKHAGKYSGVEILPFIAALKIVKELNGLTKGEMAIFLFNILRMTELDNVIKEIKEFRKKLRKIQSREAKGQFVYNYQVERLSQIFGQDLEERREKLKEFYSEGRKDPSFLASVEGQDLLREIVRTGKGWRTQRAQRQSQNLQEMIRQGEGLSKIEERYKTCYTEIKIGTLWDYADLNFRYMRLSGLFTAKGNRMVISEDQKFLADYILKQSWKVRSIPNRFLEDWFWNPQEPKLPLDDISFLQRRARLLEEEQTALRKKIKTVVNLEPIIAITPGISIQTLKYKVYELEKQTVIVREINYYEKMQEPSAIDEIDSYYDLILQGELLGGNKPAHFEWNTWRGFLAIDKLASLPHECRSFEVNADLTPKDFAGPYKPDMVFTYPDFKIVCEVTLQRGPAQWASEAEPVPRHVAKVQVGSEVPVYCVFIAPEIDLNTAIQFFGYLRHLPYVTDNGQRLNLRIIPLNLNQWRGLLRFFKIQSFSPQYLREFLKILTGLANNSQIKDGKDWINLFPAVIEEWKQNVNKRN